LKEEFFIALGENKTIVHLNLNNVTYTNANVLNLLGKACAMNKKKDGSIKYLGLANAFQNYINFKSFLDAFKISDYMQEMWYGDKKIAKEMTKEQLENKLYYGLDYLDIGRSILTGNNFKHKDLEKRKQPQWPTLLEVFCN
jgi:hypothetical protein